MRLFLSIPRRTATAVVLAALTGCTVGPDYHRPALSVDNAYTPDGTMPAPTAGAMQSFRPGQDIPAQWWDLFHCPALNGLVTHAIAHSPNLASAHQALLAAQEGVAAQKGALWPNISGFFNPTRNKISQGMGVQGFNSYLYNLHTLQLNISYMPDVWGGIRRQIEASDAQRALARFQLEAAYLSLTSNLVAAAIQYAAIRGQIEATEGTIASARAILAINEQQARFGDLGERDVTPQRLLLAQAEQALPPLRQQLAVQHDLIAALAGDGPDVSVPDFRLADFHLPTDLPVSLPLQLIDQRPDIRAAEETVRAASAQIGVAVAARLPDLNLVATPGLAVNRFSQFATPGYGTWTLAAMITQPLFDGFTLLHQERGARATYQKAAEDYRSTIVLAVQNVSDALHAIHNDADTLVASVKAEDQARQALNFARTGQRYGDESTLLVLMAEQGETQARMTMVQAQSAQLSDTVGLFQALGGGWWNRRPATP
ncbi:efflux transporter outer membrane subunit [Acetobacter orientalis]|mgnify:FL=1|jgi:NodT family efflux transporter outer membrane factor (OMF) lipoprotein|uniref:efflux transporter outer membrane subunit n=1 Tax=Acetobacteraceae TaxID=433 RepID=UPI00209E4F6A|nr:efflux transporter outer membrane subunit [Acetobacter orientalis]MCP1216654.1 efflux transporter outer membrane subunit [Acetobacter orientalis]MCP1219590.1 efflux transporter outer membrane subunit [Acetobacter orientalis]